VSAGRVGAGTLLAFGAPASGYAFTLLFIQFYFLKFATDVLLLAPLVGGALVGAGRLWDAVSDPLAGYWSDRTRTRLGRRRPWMLAAVPLMAVFFVMTWSPPGELDGGALVAWCGAALFGFYTAFTVYTVPHLSLGAELSQDHHERSRVFAAQRIAFVLGMMAAFGGVQLLRDASEPRGAAFWLSVTVAGGSSLVLLVCPAVVRERREYLGRGASSPFAALGDVLRNPHARVLLAAWLVDGLGGGVLGVLAPFVAEYVLMRPDLMAALPAAYLLSAVVSIPLWVLLSRRFGKRGVWRAALVGSALSLGATFFLGEGDLAPLIALLVVAGACGGCGGAIGQSMLADVIDWDELRSGERKEGAYSAAWGFALKLSIGLVVVIAGAVLQLSGFTPNVEQAPAAALGIRGLFAGMPFAAGLGAAFTLRRFHLDATAHRAIRAELDSGRPGSREG
jgi:GPH family glycoside/pentoside/hexuronide:cation symporter